MRQGNEEPSADASRQPGDAERGERASGEESALFDFAEWLGTVAPESPVATRRLAERVMGVEEEPPAEAEAAEAAADVEPPEAAADQEVAPPLFIDDRRPPAAEEDPFAPEAGVEAQDAAPADDADRPAPLAGPAADDADWWERPRIFDPFRELRAGPRADDAPLADEPTSADEEPPLDRAAAYGRWDEPAYDADTATTAEPGPDVPADAWREALADAPDDVEAVGSPSPYLKPPVEPPADAPAAPYDPAPSADLAPPAVAGAAAVDDGASPAAPPRRRLMSAVTQPRGRAVERAPAAAAADPKARRRYVAAGAVGLMVVSAVAVAVSLSTVVERERTGGVSAAAESAAAAAVAESAAAGAPDAGAATDAPAASPVSFATASGGSASRIAAASFAGARGGSGSTLAPASFAGARGRSASVLAAAAAAPAARGDAPARTPGGAAATAPRVAAATTGDSARSTTDSAAADSAAAAAPAVPARGGVRGLASRVWDRAREAVVAIAGGRRAGDASAFAVAGASASADSAPVLLPQPPALVGRWIHGDTRTKYGDSLTMVLNADGTATATERRYVLDRTGWHQSRLSRSGRWEMRYGRTERLCTDWETPVKVRTCEAVTLSTDTATDLPLLRYAGRHWRPPRTDRSPTDRPRRDRSPDDE